MLSGIEHETWIDGGRADWWTAAGWITVVIMICSILVDLVSVWWISARVGEIVSNGTQTLEQGGRTQGIPQRVTITKHGKAAHCRCECPFLWEAHAIQSLSWCSHCDPNDALEKHRFEARERE